MEAEKSESKGQGRARAFRPREQLLQRPGRQGQLGELREEGGQCVVSMKGNRRGAWQDPAGITKGAEFWPSEGSSDHQTPTSMHRQDLGMSDRSESSLTDPCPEFLRKRCQY